MLDKLFEKLKQLQDVFYKNGISDIYTNSKIFEILLAEQFQHKIVNGHANSLDAMDNEGNYYEYKHYKLSSSNHTWTFNDFTDRTINNLCNVKTIFFVVIDDANIVPQINKIYAISGADMAQYLEEKTRGIKNKRKMINISEHQIITNLYYELIEPEVTYCSDLLSSVFDTVHKIEKITGINGILTSNKLWELLVARELKHSINPEQKKHDAIDDKGKTYEYKVSIKNIWTFQDISDNVLENYLMDEGIVLACVDKTNFCIKSVYICNPEALVLIIKNKRDFRLSSPREIRRLSETIGMTDVKKMIDNGDAKWVL